MPFIFSHGQTCCESVVSPVCAIDFVKLSAHALDEDLLKKIIFGVEKYFSN